MNQVKQRRRFFLAFFCLSLMLPIVKATDAQGGAFLPDGLQQITTRNAGTLEQLVVIAPDGSDLTGATSAEPESFAQAPSGSQHWITSVAFSRDGQYLAAGSYDTSIRVWNMATGERILTLLGHREMVNDVAFSPDGLLIASCSGAYDWYQDFSVRLWKAGTGASISVLKGHRDEVESLSFSPDGATIASASLDGTIRLWDVESGDEILIINASDEWVGNVQFDSTGHLLLSAGNDNSVKLWNAQSGDLIRTMLHKDWVFDAQFSPDQSNIASSSRDGTVRLWETATGELLATYQVATGETDKDGFPLFPYRVAFAPSGNLLAVAFGNSIELWDTQSAKMLVKLNGHTGQVYDLDFNSNGTLLASSGFDGTIRLWGVASSDG